MAIKIGLIGGQGQMGRWFKRFFAAQGLEVLVADVDTEQTSQEVARLADVVMHLRADPQGAARWSGPSPPISVPKPP